MTSEDLVHLEKRLVEIVTEHVWNNLESIEHVPYSYKTRRKISKEVRNILELFSVEDDLTARYIRYTPQAFIVQQNPKVLYLLDYKCMIAPVCDDWIIEKFSQNADRRVESYDIGKLHTTSYDNYIALKDLGVKVAILTYIAYHKQLLLCDFIENIETFDPYKDENGQTERNGEPSVYFDVTKMRTFEEFLIKENRVTSANIVPKIQEARRKLIEDNSIDRDSEVPLVG